MEENKTAVELEMTKETPAEDITSDRIKNITVRIGGRQFQLVYNIRAQIQIDDELEMDFDALRDALNRRRKPNTKVVVTALRIMGNLGLKAAGEPADLTDEWIIDHMIPKDLFSYRVAALTALTKGWYMETDHSAEQDQDVTLIEIRKKNGSTD